MSLFGRLLGHSTAALNKFSLIQRWQSAFALKAVTGTVRSHLLQEANGAKRIVGYWMVGTSGLVFGMVVLGGITRLTESGLSMVDWSLVHFRAPGSEADWQRYFELYQRYPEYQLHNQGMTLEEFKRIYWLEHAHRVYGRLLGLYVMGPAALFAALRWSGSGMRRVSLACSSLVLAQVHALDSEPYNSVGTAGMVHGKERPWSRDC